MTPEELMKLLDIKPKETKPLSLQSESSTNTVAEAKSTVLKLDRWDLSQGERLSEIPIVKTSKLNPLEMADFHGVCFLPEPTKNEACLDKRRQQYLSTLLESPEYQSLHGDTAFNLNASDLASIEFGKAYAVLKAKDEERKEKNKTKPQDEKSKAKEEAKSEAACMGAVNKGLKNAEKEVSDYKECCRGLGGDGPENKKIDPSEMLKNFERVKNNSMLRQIFNEAGKWRRFAQAKQRVKIIHGYDDVVGVELGGDLAKLVPLELSLLADEDLEYDALRRFVENQSVIRQHKGVERVSKGPIVGCFDESGSMSGKPLISCKLIALTLAYLARHQKRWCCLIGYSGGTQGNLLALPPNKWDQGKLLDWLCHFFSGGTQLDIPLRELPTKFWTQLNPPKGKTDLFIVSDALCHIPKELSDSFNLWRKKEQVKCTSFILNNPPGDLAKVSDKCYSAKSINLDDPFIEECLSI